MKGPLFYSKILLFGEYGIIRDSKGLSIPYNFYNGALKKSEEPSAEAIASNKSFEFVRKWLLDKVRIVALLDLPENIFAETGVNTTIIIGYKPSQDELNKLKESNYKIFTRDIKNVGYEKKTSNRNVFFDKVYKLDFESFETVLDDEGDSILDEDFTDIIKEFKEWCLFQEIALKSKFLD